MKSLQLAGGDEGGHTGRQRSQVKDGGSQQLAALCPVLSLSTPV